MAEVRTKPHIGFQKLHVNEVIGMSKQTTKAQCWSCDTIFHMVIESAGEQSYSYIEKIVPCPFCQAQCKVELRADHVAIENMLRGDRRGNGETPWFDQLPRDALIDHVFKSEEGPSESNRRV